MAIFNGYVSFPEGTLLEMSLKWHGEIVTAEYSEDFETQDCTWDGIPKKSRQNILMLIPRIVQLYQGKYQPMNPHESTCG